MIPIRVNNLRRFGDSEKIRNPMARHAQKTAAIPKRNAPRKTSAPITWVSACGSGSADSLNAKLSLTTRDTERTGRASAQSASSSPSTMGQRSFSAQRRKGAHARSSLTSKTEQQRSSPREDPFLSRASFKWIGLYRWTPHPGLAEAVSAKQEPTSGTNR